MWKDISSYSRDDKDRIPKTWALIFPSGLRLVVTRHKDYPPDQWVARMTPLFDFKVLKSKDIDIAKKEAIRLYLKVKEKDSDFIDKLICEAR